MRVLVTAIALLTVACGRRAANSEKVDGLLEGWSQETFEDFSFRLPPGFATIPVIGDDSFVGRYEADHGDTVVTFDFGWYSNDLQSERDLFEEYRAEKESIGGRDALVVTGRLKDRPESSQTPNYIAAATWRNLEAPPGTDPASNMEYTHLTVWAWARDPTRMADLLTLLRSVQITFQERVR